MQKKFTDNQIHRIYSKWVKKLQLSDKTYNEEILILIRASGRYLGIYEEWKSIPEYEGMYQVSNFGRVKSFKYSKLRILTNTNSADGYHMVNLSKCGISKTTMVHKLVAVTFLNHLPNGYNLVINHINYIKTDNTVTNLELITNRENSNKKHIKHSSKYTGVSFDKRINKWISLIYVDKKLKYLGCYENEHDAHLAYENELSKINNQLKR